MKTTKIKELNICTNCHGILIFTMKFPYAESYCMACGGRFGMFNTDTIKATPEKIKEYKKLQAQFEKIARPIVFRGCQRIGCDKCVGSVHHADHMTYQEKDDHQKALDKLYEIADKRQAV